jgi:hypothetical protein
MRKALNIISVTWHANLCHLALNCCLNVLCVSKSFATQCLLQPGNQNIVTWTEVRRIWRVL